MIRNLNQINFRSFGIIAPERAQKNPPFPMDSAVSIELKSDEAISYQAVDNTWIANASGMAILTVQSEHENLYFYLDKSVCIRAGVCFTVSSFLGKASVAMYAQKEPILKERLSGNSLRVDRRACVEGIYTFFYQEKEQGFLFPGESHPMPEFTYVDQGELHSVADGQDLLLKQGDLTIYGPNQWHMQYSDIGVAPRFVTISFDLQGIDLKPLLNRKFAAPQQVVSLLQSMLREQEHMDFYSSDIIISQLTLILLSLLREADQPTGSKVKNTNVVQNENEIIRRAQQYITAHIREKLSVPMIAQQVDVSASYLTVLFHKNLQISPGEYIRRIKLQESKQMIREHNMSFTQIASELHYSTVHHFSRQFKEKFGITPTEYAKSVRG